MTGQTRTRIPEVLAAIVQPANANAGHDWHYPPHEWRVANSSNPSAQYIAATPPQSAPVTDAEHPMMYCTNNGILCIVDEDGTVYFVPLRELRRYSPQGTVVRRTGGGEEQAGHSLYSVCQRLLEAAGFKSEYFFVHHSNDGGAYAARIFPMAFRK